MRNQVRGITVVLFLSITLSIACSALQSGSSENQVDSVSRNEDQRPTEDDINDPLFETKHPNWTSHTNANFIQDMALDNDGYLWTVGDGGAVRWNLDDGSYQKITSEHGLPENHITSITIASDGSLWFGSDQNGVAVYDGQEWGYVSTQNGLLGDSVHDIEIDQNNQVLVATDGGTSRLDSTTQEIIFSTEGFSIPTFSLLVDSQNRPWYGTNNRLSRWDGDGFFHVFEKDGLGGKLVRTMIEGEDGSIWVGTQDGGVSRYHGNTWQSYTEKDELSSNWVYSLLEDRNGNIWIGTRNGLSILEKETMKITDSGLDLNLTITCLSLSQDGSILAGTPGSGVLRINEGVLNTYLTSDSLPHNNLEALGVSNDNLILSVTGDRKISQYQSGAWETLTIIEENQIPIPRSPKESLWFQHPEGGFYSFDGKSWKVNHNPDLAGSLITSVVLEEDGTIWLTTHNSGVYQYKDDSWTNYTEQDGLASNHVTTGISASDGSIWFGTESNGVTRFKDGEWATFTKETGLVDDSVFVISNAPGDEIWFGTNFGLSRFDGGSWKSYIGDVLSGVRVLHISDQPQGVLWIGTMDGVISFDGEGWIQYSPIEGLAGAPIEAILEWENHHLVFGTLQAGVSSFLSDTYRQGGTILESVAEYLPVDASTVHRTEGSSAEGFQGPTFLELGLYEMEWHERNSISGYLSFNDHQTTLAVWQFRPSGKTELNHVQMTEVQEPFYGRSDPGGEATFGYKWGSNSIIVELGDIILAQYYDDPSVVFVLKISEVDDKGVTVDYVTVDR
jgi:ligand-binding sensor domain-containing protein